MPLPRPPPQFHTASDERWGGGLGTRLLLAGVEAWERASFQLLTLFLSPPLLPSSRELGSKDPKDLALDASGTRCFSAFLVELAQRVPGAVLPTISVLLPHLSGEVGHSRVAPFPWLSSHM